MPGSPRWPASADVAIRTKIRSVRRGDIIVVCHPARRDGYEADDLKLVLEVHSSSNKGIDWLRKPDGHRVHPTLRYVLLVESETPKATLAVRGVHSWTNVDFHGLDGTIDLPETGCRLEMNALYEGVTFEPEANWAPPSAPPGGQIIHADAPLRTSGRALCLRRAGVSSALGAATDGRASP